MTDYKVTDTELTNVANAIRTKGGTSSPLEWPQGYIDAINAISGGGVEIVPFSSGTDEQIVAMIQAAHDGDIDLQTDGGWAVGDKRSINISAFTAKDKSVSAQTVDIAISSFDDYMSCGCVMQFDFVDAISTKYSMYNSQNWSGYDTSHPYTTILPALVDALPSYLKDMLIEFSCLASAGGRSSTIETITGNKLALRSVKEITGSAGMSYEGEGSQVSYYVTSANRIKKFGHSGSASVWWTRSASQYDVASNISIASDGSPSQVYNYTDECIAPFGCI